MGASIAQDRGAFGSFQRFSQLVLYSKRLRLVDRYESSSRNTPAMTSCMLCADSSNHLYSRTFDLGNMTSRERSVLIASRTMWSKAFSSRGFSRCAIFCSCLLDFLGQARMWRLFSTAQFFSGTVARLVKLKWRKSAYLKCT